jgi:hypothetical protein
VGEEDGLRTLQVCVTRKNNLAVRASKLEERFLHGHYALADIVSGVAQPQTQISSDLIVAAPSRVQLQASWAYQIDKARFDKRMHIFGFVIDVLGFRFSLVLDLVQSRCNPASFVVSDHACLIEGTAIGNACAHIDLQQSPIELKRTIKAREAFISFALKTPTPKVL